VDHGLARHVVLHIVAKWKQRDGYLLKLETTMPKKRRERNEAKKA
jgi:hypothetical protein